MDIILSHSSEKPIYEQITAQVKRMIASGELTPGEMLPSMRVLARDLRISVITTKRAYQDLERDGFIETVAGKGSYVAGKNAELIREEHLRQVEEHLGRAVEAARMGGITKAEILEMTDLLFEEE